MTCMFTLGSNSTPSPLSGPAKQRIYLSKDLRRTGVGAEQRDVLTVQQLPAVHRQILTRFELRACLDSVGVFDLDLRLSGV